MRLKEFTNSVKCAGEPKKGATCVVFCSREDLFTAATFEGSKQFPKDDHLHL